MLVTAAQFVVVHAAHCLGAEDVATEETDAWVTELFLGVRAAAPIRFFDEAVVELGQADKLEDCWVGEARPESMILEANAGARCVPVEDPA